LQDEAFKHGFAVRTALGDPGTPEGPFKASKAIHAAVRDLLDDSFVTHLRSITSDDSVLRDTVYGGRWGQINYTGRGMGVQGKGQQITDRDSVTHACVARLFFRPHNIAFILSMT
jgi:hypothetical protein